MCIDEAIQKFGKDNLKIYRTKFNPMYHAITTRKTPSFMKLITVLPTEKVRYYLFAFKDKDIIDVIS